MNKLTKAFFIINLLLVLTSCNDADIETTKGINNTFNFREFFRGDVEGWGTVENWRGEVKKTFKVSINGVWDDGLSTITETSEFNDGSTLNRSWKIILTPKGQYAASTDDVVGNALGFESGNAAQFSYVMKAPFAKGDIELRVTNQMFVLNDGTVIASINMRKFGFKVGEINVFMKKKDTKQGTWPSHKKKKTIVG
jgi:Protein of unknown function (DUF3833)